ncbi:hypothetical protein BL240_20940 [Pseudomonas putida]|uniref:Uncharacterized protein n=1 Tax=Pseudomonas putida TaxID=303 RepID=A0A1L5PUQ2_PSEPU|nr:hypothetical protein BL240_20940 [Pseudomonas putida]
MAPAAPVIAGKPAPHRPRREIAQPFGLRSRIENKVREGVTFTVGAGAPAKGLTRCMAPATPVFAGAPAPTEPC